MVLTPGHSEDSGRSSRMKDARIFQVREILGHCTCPSQFPMVKVSEGKYKVGDSSALIFVRNVAVAGCYAVVGCQIVILLYIL
ncbi:hypothetical protein JRQ81_007608 [Phrynocephalus forsythii]|uniref:GAR domain-containing protein n=1 Tax=Phrynocephalus forsythii TaxID=171643 RepID=A0A9Q1ATL0_9SAUR|nr:hypothetical protein JRQ81_007608 [Phrynocephalus forsythii]